MNTVEKPFFTIITSTLNAMETVDRCVNSVANQTFRNYEHIIVDGASTDGTAEYLLSRKELFSVLISEPDTGIYNAWNKALKHVRGEWVLFLGADDILADLHVLEDAATYISENNAKSGLVYGDLMLVSKANYEDREIVSVSSEKIVKRSPLVLRPSLPPHPATFHHNSVFIKKREFDENLEVAADSKLLLEVIVLDKVPFIHISRVINRMTPDGVSSAIGSRALAEERRILDELAIPYSRGTFYWMYLKNFLKLLTLRVFGKKCIHCLLDCYKKIRGKKSLITTVKKTIK